MQEVPATNSHDEREKEPDGNRSPGGDRRRVFDEGCPSDDVAARVVLPGAGRDPVGQVAADEVEHDRDDHLVRPRRRLKHTGNPAPDCAS